MKTTTLKADDLRSKKITMATLKSFIRKSETLFASVSSSFDGMQDCVAPVEAKLKPVSKEDAIGFKGVYCVGGGGDWLKFVENETMFGIEVYNCCGCGILWTNK